MSIGQPRPSVQKVTFSGSLNSARSAVATCSSVSAAPSPVARGLAGRLRPSRAPAVPARARRAGRRPPRRRRPPSMTSSAGSDWCSMLAPVCRLWSSVAPMILADGLPEVRASRSAPPRSTQSSARMTSASQRSSRAAGPGTLNGGRVCAGWSVGNTAASLRSVTTQAPSRSASLTRCCQACASRAPRPNMITGRCASLSSAAACSIALCAGPRRRRRREARHVGPLRLLVEPLLLQAGIEADVDRRGRRAAGHQVGAAHRLDERLARARLVVPFDERADQARPGRARCGSSRSTAGASRRRAGRWRRARSSARGRTRRCRGSSCRASARHCCAARRPSARRSPWRSRARSRPNDPRAGRAACRARCCRDD